MSKSSCERLRDAIDRSVESGDAALPVDVQRHVASCESCNLLLLEAVGRGVVHEALPTQPLPPRLHALQEEGLAQLSAAAATSAVGEGKPRLVATAPEQGPVPSDREHQSRPGLPTSAPPTSNLPRLATSFIGRRRELQKASRLLSGNRLLTLTGFGGGGKTRLALELAGRVCGNYPGGVCVVELQGLADPGLVPQTVAAALGLREVPGQPLIEALIAYLRRKTFLLVLDNCEHLLGACGHLTDALIRGCAHLRVLVTSREPLGIDGEKTYRVPSLSLFGITRDSPTEHLWQSDAIRLFVERAQARDPGFDLADESAPFVVQICRRLDGIPLAIELATAWLPTLSVRQIAGRLDDRFRLLTKGSRTAPPRQTTLEASIDWSYGMLAAEERLLLQRLSVFAGAWALEAARAVCAGDGLDSDRIEALVPRLVSKSLAVVDSVEQETRYRLLETMREYARGKLGQPDAQARALLHYLVHIAEAGTCDLLSEVDLVWLDQMSMHRDDARAALAWALEGDAAEGLRLAAALGPYWWYRGHYAEGREWLDRALRVRGDAPPLARAKALHMAAELALCRHDLAQADALAKESLAQYTVHGCRLGMAAALFTDGVGAHLREDWARSTALVSRALSIWRELGHAHGVAAALDSLAEVARKQEDWDEAEARAQEALAAAREAKAPLIEAGALRVVGFVAEERGDYEAAQEAFEESLSVAVQAQQQGSVAFSLRRLGKLRARQGDFGAAVTYLQDCLRLGRGMWRAMSMLQITIELAVAEVGRREEVRAARLFGAIEHQREVVPHDPADEISSDIGRELERQRPLLCAVESLARAWAEGRHMMLEEAVDYALTPVPEPSVAAVPLAADGRAGPGRTSATSTHHTVPSSTRK